MIEGNMGNEVAYFLGFKWSPLLPIFPMWLSYNCLRKLHCRNFLFYKYGRRLMTLIDFWRALTSITSVSLLFASAGSSHSLLVNYPIVLVAGVGIRNASTSFGLRLASLRFKQLFAIRFKIKCSKLIFHGRRFSCERQRTWHIFWDLSLTIVAITGKTWIVNTTW